MNTTIKSAVSSLLFAAAAMAASSASAVTDISSPDAAVTLGSDGTAHFGDKFKANQQSAVFNDKFTFTLSAASDVSMIVTSISTKATNGLNLSGLGLYNSQNQLVVGGHMDLTNAVTAAGFEDQWSLSALHLAGGSYYFKVGGNMVSSGGGAFAGNGTVTVVPEPATYGMLLGGLGLVGLVARRRKAA
ncbi:hypothetical protein RugamoR57_54100 [Duganella caerulea]|uniref:FxDxF family PEP-CTERM protein n=1 Tax=Duganella caerulea TaxID=2885762 RepID=UPI0030E7680D